MIMDNMVIFIADGGPLEFAKRISIIEVSERNGMGIYF